MSGAVRCTRRAVGPEASMMKWTRVGAAGVVLATVGVDPGATTLQLAVQEFRDQSGDVPQRFLDQINQYARHPYAMIVGPRLGRTASKEQYVIYYRGGLVRFLDRFTLGTVGHELVPNSAQVFRYDREFGISSRLVQAVSDHYPVFAEFSVTGPDDDGPRRR